MITDVLNTRDAGIVGLCITGFLWVIASWRLFYHYSGLCGSDCCRRPEEDEDINHLRADGLTTKRIVHCLLWAAMIVEAVAYSDMVGTYISKKVNYALLDIVGRGILEFSTYTIVTIYWFNLICEARAGASEKKFAFTLFPLILALVSIGLTVSSTLEAVVLLTDDLRTLDEFRATSHVHRICLLTEAAAWGIHSIIVSICGSMVFNRISSLPTFAQVRSQTKHNIITKMMIPIIFCALSYALRSAWMAADFISRVINPKTTFETGVGWWVGNVWIPTLIPCVMLLYSIRKRDRAPGYIDGVSDALLLPQRSEIQDPFHSFNSTFRDIEDDDNATLTSNK